MEQSQIQTEIETLIIWLNSFPHLTKKCQFMNTNELVDGIIILEVLSQMQIFRLKKVYRDGSIWPRELISYDECSFSKANFILINQGLTKFYKKYGCPALENIQRKDMINPDPNKFSQVHEILKILQLVLGVAVQCENKESLINDILQNLDEDTQSELMKQVQYVLQKYAPQSSQELSSISNIQEVSHNFSDNSNISMNELQHTVERLELQNKNCLKTLHDFEQENASLKIQYEEALKEIDSLKSQIVKQTITKKTLNLQKTLEDLQLEHGDLEHKLDKIREFETQIEMKNQKIFEHQKNYDRLKKEFEMEKTQMLEELDIEKEKGLQMQKMEMQLQIYRKKAEDYNQLLQLCEQKDQKVRELELTISQQEQELNNKKQLEDQLKFVREELSKEKSRISQFEINVQSREDQISDLQKEIKLMKKKEEINLDKIRQLQDEIEDQKIRDNSSSLNDTSDNLQQSMISDLELRLKSLEQENEMLRLNNGAQINQKLFEIDQQLQEELRVKNMLQQQLEQQQRRYKKLEDENENLRLDFETQRMNSNQASSKQSEFALLKDEKIKISQSLQQALQKVKELETNSSQIQVLYQQRDQTLQEMKTLYQEKNQLIDEMLKLKDELNNTKSELAEQKMKEKYFEKEKQLLEQQLKNAPQADKANQEVQLLKQKMKQLEQQNKEKEQVLIKQLSNIKHDRERDLSEMKGQYEKEIRQLNNTIEALNNEVSNESRLRFEVENGYDRFYELMASLLNNLGERLIMMQKDMLSQGKWNNQTELSHRSNSDNENRYLSTKKANTYKTFH
ncbi:protein hook homolog 1 [Stylonychia lemnae]|uniref:Protein hook homolog 1 n=1 Tax=Stylonychia lemnae TaxID=5949 RepID=A0A078AZ90_STYLE|nr:protein hook homolog 1 [Stylonychia lemnae]|eukprot:CDW87765.1 protein hook homolog 1 [Stylonychia lemnae]